MSISKKKPARAVAGVTLVTFSHVSEFWDMCVKSCGGHQRSFLSERGYFYSWLVASQFPVTSVSAMVEMIPVDSAPAGATLAPVPPLLPGVIPQSSNKVWGSLSLSGLELCLLPPISAR